MATTKAGKQSLLPPRGPFPSMPPSYGDFGAKAAGGGGLKLREGQRHHQRTSSESFLIEEQPSWLDDLLDEPDTPVKKGAHRRSSSDSFAYVEQAGGFDHAAYYAEPISFGRAQNRGWESALNLVGYPGGVPVPGGKEKGGSLGGLCAVREADAAAGSVGEKQNREEVNQDRKVSPERKEGPHAKQSQSETDTKRVKQQFAQRSRVRKLQYIAELERLVQALQAEGLEASAELEFLDQQNLILNLENKALKQRLDSLAQEQLIKHLQQEMLEREVTRLKLLFQQQVQKQHQPAPTHRRSSSRDLDSQFANLFLNQKEANPAHDAVTGPLHI